MHNAVFKEMGLDYLYVPFRVKTEELGKAIEGMKALNIRGINVTIPHKVAVIQLLDELDHLAEKIGADILMIFPLFLALMFGQILGLLGSLALENYMSFKQMKKL